MELTLNCPKCNALMEKGFVIEHADPSASLLDWIAGAPELTSPILGKYKTSNARQIATYCCNGCGFLESYARLRDMPK
jgi:hypothetical protein